jgi:hypothetical protein
MSTIHILDALFVYGSMGTPDIYILAFSGELYFLGVSACSHVVCAKHMCALSPEISSSRMWLAISFRSLSVNLTFNESMFASRFFIFVVPA